MANYSFTKYAILLSFLSVPMLTYGQTSRSLRMIEYYKNEIQNNKTTISNIEKELSQNPKAQYDYIIEIAASCLENTRQRARWDAEEERHVTPDRRTAVYPEVKKTQGGITFTGNHYQPHAEGEFDYMPGIGSKPPCSHWTWTVTPNQIVVKGMERTQIASGFDPYNGRPVAPKDPFTTCLGCKGGSKTLKGSIELRPVDRSNRDRMSIPCTVTYSCKHSRAYVRQGVMTTDPMNFNNDFDDELSNYGRVVRPNGKSYAVDGDYNPYLYTHTTTASINLAAVAKTEGISMEKLEEILSNYFIDGITTMPSADEEVTNLDLTEFEFSTITKFFAERSYNVANIAKYQENLRLQKDSLNKEVIYNYAFMSDYCLKHMDECMNSGNVKQFEETYHTWKSIIEVLKMYDAKESTYTTRKRIETCEQNAKLADKYLAFSNDNQMMLNLDDIEDEVLKTKFAKVVVPCRLEQLCKTIYECKRINPDIQALSENFKPALKFYLNNDSIVKNEEFKKMQALYSINHQLNHPTEEEIDNALKDYSNDYYIAYAAAFNALNNNNFEYFLELYRKTVAIDNENKTRYSYLMEMSCKNLIDAFKTQKPVFVPVPKKVLKKAAKSNDYFLLIDYIQ